MNYEKIYNSLIQKRRIYVINRSADNKNVEYHHIIPRSCDGINDPCDAKHNNENYNIIGLTLDEHFFAHLLLQQIYKEKYGINHKYYKCMIKAVQMMIDHKKYGKKSSKFYKKLRLAAFESGSMITTANRKWVTNDKKDIFLKPDEIIPEGFVYGRTINFTEEQRKEYSRKIRESTLGRKCWNSGKHGIYSDEYRKEISDNHADVSGENNGRFGSRSMTNPKTNHRLIVPKELIAEYQSKGYYITRDLKKFNNGIIEVLDIKCPDGFKPGKLPPKHTPEELEQIHVKRSLAAKKRNANRQRTANGKFK